jgi:hypothetical protein
MFKGTLLVFGHCWALLALGFVLILISMQRGVALAGSKADHSKIAPMLICMHGCVYNLDIA